MFYIKKILKKCKKSIYKLKIIVYNTNVIRKEDKMKRLENILIKVTKEEKNKIISLAEKNGLTMSSYIRQKLLRG